MGKKASIKKKIYLFLKREQAKNLFRSLKMQFSKTNWGSIFFRKKDQTRGGGVSGGGLVKDQTFPLFLTLFLITSIFKSSKKRFKNSQHNVQSEGDSDDEENFSLR